jgi:hypothetical protein
VREPLGSHRTHQANVPFIYRVTAACAVAAWVLLELVNNVAPILDLPLVARACLLLFVLGFPIVIFFAWMREVPPSETASKVQTTVPDWALIVVIGLLSYQQLAPLQATRPAEQQQASVAAARPASASAANAISVAVLPFTNLSADKEQGFFSDGMTDEIGAALVKIPVLAAVHIRT